MSLSRDSTEHDLDFFFFFFNEGLTKAMESFWIPSNVVSHETIVDRRFSTELFRWHVAS